jgi:hypothetical protein
LSLNSISTGLSVPSIDLDIHIEIVIPLLLGLTNIKLPLGSGEAAAVKVFQEACGRTMMVQMIVNDTSGRMGMLTGSSGPPMDYGESVKQAVADLDKAIPDEHKMAGLLG